MNSLVPRDGNAAGAGSQSSFDASADAVLSAEEKEAGVVLVDIGGGTTDIAI